MRREQLLIPASLMVLLLAVVPPPMTFSSTAEANQFDPDTVIGTNDCHWGQGPYVHVEMRNGPGQAPPESFRFYPENVNIQACTMVIWHNVDPQGPPNVEHTTTELHGAPPDLPLWDSLDVNPEWMVGDLGTYSVWFAMGGPVGDAGTFGYRCENHFNWGMVGNVTVG